MEFKKSSSSVIVTAVIAALSMGAGLIIGYLLRPAMHKPVNSGHIIVDSHNRTYEHLIQNCSQAAKGEAYVQKYLQAHDIQACRAYTCHIPLPKTYQVYHLETEVITIDGKLDDKGWKDVPWSDPFIDIKGADFPKPKFETRIKVRWDDTHFYFAAYMEETDVWANKSLHDTTVYQDNAIQVLLDTRQSNHKYKELTINAIGTMSDMMLTRPYMNDGEPLSFWESDVNRAVFVDGPINNPNKDNKFWTVEMSIPFATLYAGLYRQHDYPSDGETWRANFVRPEYETEVVDGKYQKKLGVEASWWVWSSPGVSNIHLPDRWGLLQFTKAVVNTSTFEFGKEWIVTNALLDTFRAEKAYKAVNGRYTDDVTLLDIPPYVLSGKCIKKVEVKIDWGGFTVTVYPNDNKLKEGHIRTDRYIWYGDEKEEFF
ncbi:hypothetical protein LOTGIDRAFT_164342 [Lottia gigantea]|uniref:Carbohydrate-binding domain-containing protein n=1 Tax=Lottia gigantea TaxID=225164 RepID=V4A070_LOTGI|nr:hypothetical protein LOTGIDRAFT_164342 [Lottia gigantea]ESO90042.1 hypothetical protein LOTGIDRAFT_164342 [Lottia gigantea]